jgi:hypothetical protein
MCVSFHFLAGTEKKLKPSVKIGDRLVKDGYTPRTWHTHPLHLCPPEPYDPAHPGTRTTLDWIFLISSLNFSFWSQYDGTECCYGVEWREGWGSEHRIVHTGYWSLVAALDRGTPHVIFSSSSGLKKKQKN